MPFVSPNSPRMSTRKRGSPTRLGDSSPENTPRVSNQQGLISHVLLEKLQPVEESSIIELPPSTQSIASSEKVVNIPISTCFWQPL